MTAHTQCPLCGHTFWFDPTKVSASVSVHDLSRPATPDLWRRWAEDLFPTCTKCGQKVRVDNPLREACPASPAGSLP